MIRDFLFLSAVKRRLVDGTLPNNQIFLYFIVITGVDNLQLAVLQVAPAQPTSWSVCLRLAVPTHVRISLVPGVYRAARQVAARRWTPIRWAAVERTPWTQRPSPLLESA